MVGTLLLANGDGDLQTSTAEFFQYIPVLIQIASHLFQSWAQNIGQIGTEITCSPFLLHTPSKISAELADV